MTAAFIIQVLPQLQPDPSEETTALLRVLIYKIDNTTFGSHAPDLPPWTGPPQTIVQVQAILFASLTTSLFSAFLAMLGKQWLNRYASTDMRGTAIERSQNRQRKLDGITSWHFDHVIESLPLMLQAALLLSIVRSPATSGRSTSPSHPLSSELPCPVLSSTFSLSQQAWLLRIARIKPLVHRSSDVSSPPSLPLVSLEIPGAAICSLNGGHH